MLKSYAEKSKTSLANVEKIWDEAKKSALSTFKETSPKYWAYVNGIVRKRLKLTESTSFREFMELSFENPPVQQEPTVVQTPDEHSMETHMTNYGGFISCLFAARDKAHELHLGTGSYAEHMALNELYELLVDHADKMAEMFQGKYGKIPMSTPSADIFQDSTGRSFACALTTWLEGTARTLVGDDPYIINQLEELIALVFQVKYKLEQLS